MIHDEDSNIEYFKNLEKNDKLSPCWILKGEKSIGKANFAKKLSKEILYSNSRQNHGLSNTIVSKQMDEGYYPNFLYITPPLLEDGTKSREINAETAKLVKKFLQKKSAILGWRVVLIDSLDQMNRFAANSLLKILEEPPQKTLILMICHQLGSILPTIRSRSQIFHLKGNPDLLEQEKDFVDLTLDFLKSYMEGKNSVSESFFKTVIEKDKSLISLRYILLNLVSEWVMNEEASVPSFYNAFQKQHWIKVYQSINSFFISHEQAHLDPTQSLTALFYIFKKPELSL
ncbi:MAG: AAA family ATPase [Proteobacteria bacterium]|nr:AAA family ATPase [Pseudomonadota bacterium]